MRSKNAFLGVSLILLFFLADFFSKAYIAATVPLGGVVPVIKGFFNIVDVRNTGVAFGVFAHLGGISRVVVLCLISGLVFIVIFFLIVRGKRRDTWFIVALSMIGGGALGNLYDRIVKGYVIDFLDFHLGELHYPAFNLADSFITLGMFALFLFLVSRKSRA